MPPLLFLLGTTSCLGGVVQDGSVSGALNPNDVGGAPGLIHMHRLNRAEYNNSVRDLLGTLQAPADSFPPDVASSGFDNVSSAQTLTPALVTLYQSAALSLAEEAIDANHIAHLVSCDPNADLKGCLSQTVAAIGLRAWRRPLTNPEVQHVVALAQAGDSSGSSFTLQLEVALVDILLSPNFLFRIETAALDANNPPLLSSYELASRLSYFLWSSIPDAELLNEAADGNLMTVAGLTAQVDRMLSDPRSQALTNNFVGQWLQTRQVATYVTDFGTYPTWTAALGTDMVNSTNLFFTSFITQDAPVSTMLTANYMYLDNTLASFYGLPSPNSNTLIRTTIPATARMGIMTQGAVLVANSAPARSSPVKRGKLVLTALTCQNIPDPPPNTPALPATTLSGTQRQELQQHVSTPNCASCHNLMDPPGFAYEEFDGIGQLRSTENGQPIDSTGSQSGQAFTNAASLAAILAQGDTFSTCLASKMFVYALGRDVQSTDVVPLQGITQGYIAQNASLRKLIDAIVLSDTFKRAAPSGS